jgi:TolB-like protein
MDAYATNVCYEFGEFRLEPGRRVIWGRQPDERINVSPKVFDAALYLVERPGVLLPKDRLLADLWPHAIVEENNLTHVISLLRRVLGETRGENRYIATVPRRGYRFVAEVMRLELSTARVLLPARTIAVLPFFTVGTHCDDAAIAAGIAESLLHRIAGIDGLKLVAQTSSFAFRSPEADARDIGRRLNSRFLIEGSVRHADRQLRIMVQLIDAVTGTHIWSLMFDHTIDDILAVEDDVATCVARKLECSIAAQASI